MSLCGEIDDVAWVGPPSFKNEHGTRHYALLLARFRVGREVCGERLLELQGNSFAHNSDDIHRVHKGVDVGRAHTDYDGLAQLSYGNGTHLAYTYYDGSAVDPLATK